MFVPSLHILLQLTIALAVADTHRSHTCSICSVHARITAAAISGLNFLTYLITS